MSPTNDVSKLVWKWLDEFDPLGGKLMKAKGIAAVPIKGTVRLVHAASGEVVAVIPHPIHDLPIDHLAAGEAGAVVQLMTKFVAGVAPKGEAKAVPVFAGMKVHAVEGLPEDQMFNVWTIMEPFEAISQSAGAKEGSKMMDAETKMAASTAVTGWDEEIKAAILSPDEVCPTEAKLGTKVSVTLAGVGAGQASIGVFVSSPGEVNEWRRLRKLTKGKRLFDPCMGTDQSSIYWLAAFKADELFIGVRRIETGFSLRVEGKGLQMMNTKQRLEESGVYKQAGPSHWSCHLSVTGVRAEMAYVGLLAAASVHGWDQAAAFKDLPVIA